MKQCLQNVVDIITNPKAAFTRLSPFGSVFLFACQRDSVGTAPHDAGFGEPGAC